MLFIRQGPPVLLNVPAAANVPAPEEMYQLPLQPFQLRSSASLVAAQGGNDFPANSLAGNEPGKVNIYVNISHVSQSLISVVFCYRLET